MPVSATRCCGPEAAHGAGGQRAGVLHRLRLVEHEPVPVDVGQVVGVAGGGGVRGDQQVGADERGAQIVAARAGGAVVGADPQAGDEAGGLALPGADHRHGAEQERRTGVRVAPVVGLEGEQLHGLAETHVVGQAGTEAQRCQEREPGDPALLVGAQLRGEAGGRVDGGERAFRAAGEQVAEPADGVDAGQRQRQVAVVHARGQGEHIGRRRRPALTAAQELQAAAQRRLVHAHPGPAQPHQRRLRGDERGDLVLVQGLVADGQRPPEVGDLLAAQPAAHDHARRRCAAGRQAQPDPARAVPARGQLHPEPGVDQQRGSGDEQVVGALGAHVEAVGTGRLERGGERGVDAGRPAELGEQHLLGAGDEAVGAARPDLRGGDEQARVGGGLEQELQAPMGAVTRVVELLGERADLGEPEAGAGGAGRFRAHLVPGLQGLGQRGEPGTRGQAAVRGGQGGEPGVDGARCARRGPAGVRDAGAGEAVADGGVDQHVESVGDERAGIGRGRPCRWAARPGRRAASPRRGPRRPRGRHPARRAATGRGRPAPRGRGSGARGRGGRDRRRTRRRPAGVRPRRRSAARPPGRRVRRRRRRRQARPTAAARVRHVESRRGPSGRARGRAPGHRRAPAAAA